VDALRVQVGHAECDVFGWLEIDAGPGLHVESRMKVRIDGVKRGNRGAGRDQRARGRRSSGVVKRWIINNIALLVDQVVVLRADDPGCIADGAERVGD